MQEERNNSSAAQGSPKKSVSIGAILTKARNTCTLSQSDVAEQINLPIHIIQALEADDFDSLPGSTYVRGYLRNYARVVGVNEEGIAKLYIEQHHQEPVIEAPKRSKQSYDPAIMWSTTAVLSVLVGLVITWWIDYNSLPEQNVDVVTNVVSEKLNNDQGISDDVSNDAKDNSASRKSAISEFETNQSLEMSDLTAAELNESDQEETITADQQQAMEDASHNPTLVSSIDGAQTITVTYVEKSWTEIRDADSNTLIQGLIEPGVVRDIKGKPPFEIFLGNAPGVVIEVNGLYFDHSQYNRSNRTARFQVSSGSLN